MVWCRDGAGRGARELQSLRRVKPMRNAHFAAIRAHTYSSASTLPALQRIIARNINLGRSQLVKGGELRENGVVTGRQCIDHQQHIHGRIVARRVAHRLVQLHRCDLNI